MKLKRDNIMEVKGNPSTSSPTTTTTMPVAHQRAEPSQFPGTRALCLGSSKVLLAYKNATQHLKMATSQWKHQEKKGRVVRSPSTASWLPPPSDGHSCKRSPLDQLSALVLQGQIRLRQLGEDDPRFGQDSRQDPLSSTKPQNCRRIVVLGAPRVGKTSILRRYLWDGFAEEYQPTSEDFLRKMFHIRGETYQIDVLDASGERSFPAKRRLSILTGDIFLLVFTLDDRSSFEEVCALRAEILTAKTKLLKPTGPGQSARVPTVVCANKVDLSPAERKLSRAEVLRALGEDCAYFETSAKDRTNLEEVFEALAKRGGLPTETGPSQHRKVSIRSYQALKEGRVAGRGSPAPSGEAPCGALYPLARRPSFSTDLRQVLGPNSARKPGKPLEKCQIQ
ncbi:dexamethasone-induced Ras-related protein 1-like [Coregonus clupeaformis]|uniref:Small monomeric GTPase n=1 Tax=Coregonus suidteri TaxID=861788 RepID=A0AAN8KPX9_9TELE|nr:dexamethasone-induced Ras-related protein 1-like [Coregonus clupeaformis]XP_045075610.1 dexamethasone-induced Ras-related protein 1-like [Coregonus clupeaformis]